MTAQKSRVPEEKAHLDIDSANAAFVTDTKAHAVTITLAPNKTSQDVLADLLKGECNVTLVHSEDGGLTVHITKGSGKVDVVP